MNQHCVYSRDAKLFIIIKMLTNSAERTTSWKAISGKISHENPHLVWNPTIIIVFTSVRHRTHRERDEFCVHPTSSIPQKHFNIIIQSTRWSRIGLYLSSYPTEILHEILVSPIHATSTASFSTFELNILTIFASTRHTVLKHCLPIIFMRSEKYVSHFYTVRDKITVLYRPISTFIFFPYMWTTTIIRHIILIQILDTENFILVLTR